MAQKVRFTPLGTLVSLALIAGLIALGFYLITGRAPNLAGLFGKKDASESTSPSVAQNERQSESSSDRDRASTDRTPARTEDSARITGVLQRIRSTGVVRVGMEDEAPPMNYLVNSRREGFDVRMAERIAREIGGQSVEYVEDYYDELPALLTGGDTDLMMGGYVPDPSLRGIEWSDGYLDFGLCLIVRQGSAVREVQHLDGRSVGIYTDPAAREWVESNVPGATIREFEGTGWFSHLDQGEVDAIIYDYPFAVEEIKEFPRLRIVKLNLNAASYSVGVPAGNLDLLDAVNAAIKKITEAPDFDELVKQFFKSEQLQVQALPVGTKTYQVKSGDTLSGIAAAHLGSASAWPRLWELNKSRVGNPHLIEVGFQLQMP
jgi:ABC-type amino acid transport substrate-binding protein